MIEYRYYLKQHNYTNEWVGVTKEAFMIAEGLENFNAPRGECATAGFTGVNWSGRVEMVRAEGKQTWPA